MKLFSASPLLQPARCLVASSCLLMTLICFLGTGANVFAQTTADVCRETRKVLDQYEKEHDEVRLTLEIISAEDSVRNLMSALHKGIANGYVMNNLDLAAHYGGLQAPGISPKERLAFQKTLRPALERELQKALNSNKNDLRLQLDRMDQQVGLPAQRWVDLDCEEVLKRKASQPSTNCWNGTFKGNDTSGYAMSITLLQRIDGKVTGGWTFYHKGRQTQVTATITEATPEGNHLKGKWTQTGIEMSGEFEWQWLPREECRAFEGSFNGTKYWIKMVNQ